MQTRASVGTSRAPFFLMVMRLSPHALAVLIFSFVDAGSASDAGSFPALRFHPLPTDLVPLVNLQDPPSLDQTEAKANIYKLPVYKVSESRLRLTEDNVLTDKGRIEMAKNRFLSPSYRATFGPLSQVATYYFYPLSILGGWHPNDAEAMTLYYDDRRTRSLNEIDRLIQLESVEDPEDAKELKRVRFDQTISTRRYFFGPMP